MKPLPSSSPSPNLLSAMGARSGPSSPTASCPSRTTQATQATDEMASLLDYNPMQPSLSTFAAASGHAPPPPYESTPTSATIRDLKPLQEIPSTTASASRPGPGPGPGPQSSFMASVRNKLDGGASVRRAQVHAQMRGLRDQAAVAMQNQDFDSAGVIYSGIGQSAQSTKTSLINVVFDGSDEDPLILALRATSTEADLITLLTSQLAGPWGMSKDCDAAHKTSYQTAWTTYLHREGQALINGMMAPQPVQTLLSASLLKILALKAVIQENKYVADCLLLDRMTWRLCPDINLNFVAYQSGLLDTLGTMLCLSFVAATEFIVRIANSYASYIENGDSAAAETTRKHIHHIDQYPVSIKQDSAEECLRRNLLKVLPAGSAKLLKSHACDVEPFTCASDPIAVPTDTLSVKKWLPLVLLLFQGDKRITFGHRDFSPAGINARVWTSKSKTSDRAVHPRFTTLQQASTSMESLVKLFLEADWITTSAVEYLIEVPGDVLNQTFVEVFMHKDLVKPAVRFLAAMAQDGRTSGAKLLMLLLDKEIEPHLTDEIRTWIRGARTV